MTLAEAKKLILEEGQFVVRDSWVKQNPETDSEAHEVSHIKVLMRHGGYTKPTAEMYSGTLKEVAEFFKVEAIESKPHIDCLELDESDTAKLHVGWQPTVEDAWANDYSVITLDTTTSDAILVNVDAIPSATPEEALAKLAEAPIVVEKPVIASKAEERRKEATKKKASNEEQPKNVQ